MQPQRHRPRYQAIRGNRRDDCTVFLLLLRSRRIGARSGIKTTDPAGLSSLRQKNSVERETREPLAHWPEILHEKPVLQNCTGQPRYLNSSTTGRRGFLPSASLNRPETRPNPTRPSNRFRSCTPPWYFNVLRFFFHPTLSLRLQHTFFPAPQPPNAPIKFHRIAVLNIALVNDARLR